MKIDPRFAEKVGLMYELFPLAAPHYLRMQEEVGQLVGKAESEDILEIGVGTGLTTKPLRCHAPQARITSLDAEEAMLAQAAQNLEGLTINLVHADALEYLRAQPDASFNAVVNAFTLHNMLPAYRMEVFQEMGRVLRPGGILVSVDKIVPDNELEYWEAFRSQLDAFRVFREKGYPELEEEWIRHYFDDDAIRLTETEQHELFKRAGCGTPHYGERSWLDMMYWGYQV